MKSSEKQALFQDYSTGHTRGKTVRKCRICRCYKKRQGTAENELKWITLEYARMTSENTS